jgi:hypothetical protein
MSRFYFHAENGDLHRDEDGLELRTLADARREAARVLGELLNERPDAIWADGGLRLTVTDDQNLTLFALEVAATLAPAGGLRPRP